MSYTYAKQETLFLYNLAKQVLTAHPETSTRALADQMHVDVKTAWDYRKRVEEGRPPLDRLQMTRDYLALHPKATTAVIAAHLGVSDETARKYRAMVWAQPIAHQFSDSVPVKATR